MQYNNQDTIAAITTPIGIGALLMIRVSGDKAIQTVDALFLGKIKLKDAASHTIHYGNLMDNMNILDDVLVSVFKAPYSYTGEDSCEISTHGNPLIAQKVLQSILDQEDVRLAENGEFTKRAFINGRLDLAQAEAVVDVIEASTEASLRGARNQLDGILSKKVTLIRNKLIDISSLIELELDFAHEDIELVKIEELRIKINELRTELEKLLETYKFGKIIKEGVNVAIVGKTNVGKSSLLNYLLKESRAIVSHIPGTTRDIIREDIAIKGILFRLFDTAGIRQTTDIIEKEGVNRSEEAAKNADLVIFLNEVQKELDNELYEALLKLTTQDRIITVTNKIDLDHGYNLPVDIKISAKTGEGIDELCKLLHQKAIGTNVYSEKSAIVTNIRHYNNLKKARESLVKAQDSIKKGLSGEFISVDIRNAEEVLGEIIGAVTSDDILKNIFSRFCIGK